MIEKVKMMRSCEIGTMGFSKQVVEFQGKIICRISSVERISSVKERGREE